MGGRGAFWGWSIVVELMRWNVTVSCIWAWHDAVWVRSYGWEGLRTWKGISILLQANCSCCTCYTSSCTALMGIPVLLDFLGSFPQQSLLFSIPQDFCFLIRSLTYMTIIRKCPLLCLTHERTTKPIPLSYPSIYVGLKISSSYDHRA